MSRKNILGVLFSVLLVHPAFAQKQFSSEIKFIQYLLDKEQFPEADFLLGKFNINELAPAQKDTLYFMKGWSAYANKRLDSAISSLSRVSNSFSLYNKSHFFAAYSASYLKKTDTAKSLLAEIDLSDSATREMHAFQLAGLALLNRDFGSYDQQKKQFTYSIFALQKEEERFNNYRLRLSEHHRKSPFLAGVYSAVLPGAGKFYAGKKKQAIAAFLPIISLGALTYESYRKAGIKNARTLVFGSIFSVFYVGNIWGSVVSVKIKDREFYREYENKILFDMHIPLRNLYN